MLDIVLILGGLFVTVFAVDVFLNRHPLQDEEVDTLAGKRRRVRQLHEFQFCTSPRQAAAAEKKAMKSTGEFVALETDYFEAPSRIAGLLKYKKHEWIAVAFVARKRVIRVWWNKGPDGRQVWSLLSVADVAHQVRRLGVDTVVMLHNHPNPNPSRYRANVPSGADLRSAGYYHRACSEIGVSLLEFICERGTPHLYYAGFSSSVVPLEPIVREVATANGLGVFGNYKLRRELRRKNAEDAIPGSVVPLLQSNSEV
jgi:hypothetical protein